MKKYPKETRTYRPLPDKISALPKSQYWARLPQPISGLVHDFCAEIEPGQEPLYIRVESLPGAHVGQCYVNARKAGEVLGGNLVYGWSIWELKDAYLMAEHHAVLRQAERFIDCTPQADRGTRTLFLPSHDQTPVSEGIGYCKVPSRYKAIGDGNAARRLEELLRIKEALIRKGLYESGEYARSDFEACKCIAYLQEKAKQKRTRKRKPR